MLYHCFSQEQKTAGSFVGTRRLSVNENDFQYGGAIATSLEHQRVGRDRQDRR